MEQLASEGVVCVMLLNSSFAAMKSMAIYHDMYSALLYITLASHSGVSVRRASGHDSCNEEPGRLAAPQLRK